MAKKSGNMFDTAVQAREQEQAQITAAVTGKARMQMEAKSKITLSITEEDRLLAKKYALEHGTTVSDMLHEWIQDTCR